MQQPMVPTTVSKTHVLVRMWVGVVARRGVVAMGPTS